MKKMILLGALCLPAAFGYAQESRQEVSLSGFGLLSPTVRGNGITLQPSVSGGGLVSYRYLLTPHSGLEANYSFVQNTNYFQFGGQAANIFNPIHTRQQEASVAYVYGLSFKRYNPFVEGGVAGVIFSPIQDGTFTLDAKRNTNIGGLFGAGVAYEISPSFDIRVEFRGLVVKAPDFKLPGDRFKTNQYELISEPTLGIAYHF